MRAARFPIEDVRAAVASFGRDTVWDTESLKAIQDDAILPERLTAALAGFFGLLGRSVAGVGLYGRMSYNVTRRAREIGIRMALGAEWRRVVGGVVFDGLAVAAGGAAIGVVAGLGTVQPRDVAALRRRAVRSADTLRACRRGAGDCRRRVRLTGPSCRAREPTRGSASGLTRASISNRQSAIANRVGNPQSAIGIANRQSKSAIGNRQSESAIGNRQSNRQSAIGNRQWRGAYAMTTGMTFGVAPFSASQNWFSFTTSMFSS